MARIGKIARLPIDVREDLNRRLRDGQLGPQVLPWLNALPQVRQVLAEHFQNNDVNPQNLSDWRQGGYIEWEQQQDRSWRVKELARRAVDLAQANATSIAEGAAAIVSGKILELLETIDEEHAIPHQQLKDVVAAITALRSAEIAQQRADLDREKLKRKDQEIDLARAAFEQRLTEYQDKVNAQKRAIQDTISQAKSGGLTEDTLRQIEHYANLL